MAKGMVVERRVQSSSSGRPLTIKFLERKGAFVKDGLGHFHQLVPVQPLLPMVYPCVGSIVATVVDGGRGGLCIDSICPARCYILD